MSNVRQHLQTPQSWRRPLSMVLGSFLLLSATMAQGPGPRPVVEIRTVLGTIEVELYHETPAHRDNFLKLVREGFYDSLLFHRVIPTFMVQGGDPASRNAVTGAPLGEGGPGYDLPAEIVPGLIHRRGALAAARLGDDVNPERRSSGSQFYIVQGKVFNPVELDLVSRRHARMEQAVDYGETEKAIYATQGGAPHLDGGYTVFGQVTRGMDVVDAIAKLPCDTRDRPERDVRMFMRVLE